MKQIRTGSLLLLVLLVMLSGCATTTVRQHPDFASGKRKIHAIALLPPEVEYRHLVFTGENERDAEKEKSIAATLETGMSSLLQQRGYQPKTEILEKSRAGDKEFNFQLEQLKGAYVQVARELYAQPLVQVEESNKFKLGVGPLANPFASASGSDALLLARYQGYDKSDGLIAKEVVASALLAALTGSYYVPVKNGGQIEISLIDGVSGDVLWSNVAGGPLGAQASLTRAALPLPALAVAGEAKPVENKAAGDAPSAPQVETPPAQTPAPNPESTAQATAAAKTP